MTTKEGEKRTVYRGEATRSARACGKKKTLHEGHQAARTTAAKPGGRGEATVGRQGSGA